MTFSQAIAKRVCYLFLLSSFILLLFIFSLISRVSPWADEWFTVALTPMTFVEWAGWLFQQHNDHVILIQKVLQGGLIRASGYDFRSLILLNIFMIAGSAWAMLKLAEEYRGTNVFTDVVIVLALCCVGPNAVTWSSTFPFPATNLIVVTFALLWMRTVNAGPSRSRALVAVSLLISGPLIAAGGAVATTMICVFLWYLTIFRKDVVQPLSLIGLVVASVVNAGAWVIYRPSGASGVDISRVPDFIVGLSGGSIYWWDLPYEPLKDIVCAIFVAASILFCMLIVLRRRSDAKDLVFAAAILAVFAVMASIAVGRSAYTEWFSHLKVHYGIASALLIPLGLLLFERRSRLSVYLSGVFAVLLAVSYVVAFRFEVIRLESVQPANMAALFRLAHSSDLPRDMAEHWSDYWWRDGDKELAPVLAQRVQFIRENGGKLYKPWRAANLGVSKVECVTPQSEVPASLVNPSFEIPALGSKHQHEFCVPGLGWTFEGAGGIQGNGSIWGAAPAPNGTQTAFIQSTGSMRQTLNLAAGSHTLSFHAARRSCCVSPYLQPVKVTVDGIPIGLASPADTSFGAFSITFSVAASGPHTIMFAGTVANDMTTFIDNVAIK